MSAILGVYYLDGRPAEAPVLDRMAGSLAHRGPDGTGVWVGGSVGLGHCMLRTTPESLREAQPLVGRDGDLVITAEVRLDDREGLAAAIGLGGRPLDQFTDVDLVLAAYEKWGMGCPGRLLGDFSFAIWDRRERRLFCARDHAGVKPFYYHLRGGRTFAFASEIRALFCLPDVPRRLNEVRVADYLAQSFDDKAITFFREISRLPPGHCLAADPEGVQILEYWSFDPSRQLRYKDDEEYAEAFRDHFTEAVRCRLRSAFPVGSLLSGGLDSSSIACTASRILSERGDGRLRTYSSRFKSVAESDEGHFIDAVLARGTMDPRGMDADQIGPLADRDRFLECHDEAFYCPNLYLNWGMSQLARGDGVRVLLDGFDGDSTVSHGFAYLGELARGFRWVALTREIEGLSRNFGLRRRRMLWDFGPKALAPEGLKRVWRACKGRIGRPDPGDSVIRPEFARRIGLEGRLAAHRAGRKPGRTERQDHVNILNWGLLPFALEMLDRVTAASSVEPRYPFFDRRLMEFCLALPPRQKIRRGWTRWILREAMAGTLPDEVLGRAGKSSLAPGFARGLFTFERDQLATALVDDPAPLAEYVDLTALRHVFTRFVSDPNPTDGHVLWISATLALWLRRSGLSA